MLEKPKDVPSVGRTTQWCRRPNIWRLRFGKRPKANCQVPICETCRTITLGPVERLLVLMSFKWTNKNMLQVTLSIFFFIFWDTTKSKLSSSSLQEVLYHNTLTCGNCLDYFSEYFSYKHVTSCTKYEGFFWHMNKSKLSSSSLSEVSYHNTRTCGKIIALIALLCWI
jgi:hypothetical protein